eukprot:3164267-Pleurochrysis_carterae.AAC.6
MRQRPPACFSATPPTRTQLSEAYARLSHSDARRADSHSARNDCTSDAEPAAEAAALAASAAAASASAGVLASGLSPSTLAAAPSPTLTSAVASVLEGASPVEVAHVAAVAAEAHAAEAGERLLAHRRERVPALPTQRLVAARGNAVQRPSVKHPHIVADAVAEAAHDDKPAVCEKSARMAFLGAQLALALSVAMDADPSRVAELTHAFRTPATVSMAVEN